MKVVTVTGVRESALIDVPFPKIKDNYCLVKVLVAPACTECHGYKAGQTGDVRVTCLLKTGSFA